MDNMSTKDLVDYVSDDLFNYFDKLGEHEFLEEARNYWDDSFDEVVEEIKDYMKCGKPLGNTVRHLNQLINCPLEQDIMCSPWHNRRVTNKKTMFDSQLRPIYGGKVLANETAINNPVVKAALFEMSKRNLNPKN